MSSSLVVQSQHQRRRFKTSACLLHCLPISGILLGALDVALPEDLPPEASCAFAARIRDHPYMKLFKEISDLEKDNKRERAEELRAELDKLIESVSQDPKKP